MSQKKTLEIFIPEMNLEEDILSHYEELSEDFVLMDKKDAVRLILDISVTDSTPFFTMKGRDDKALEANSQFAEVLLGVVANKEQYWTNDEKRFAVETFVSIVLNRDLLSGEKETVKDACNMIGFMEENMPFVEFAKEFYLTFTDYEIFEQEQRGNVLDSVRLSLMLLRGECKEQILFEFEKFVAII